MSVSGHIRLQVFCRVDPYFDSTLHEKAYCIRFHYRSLQVEGIHICFNSDIQVSKHLWDSQLFNGDATSTNTLDPKYCCTVPT
jgi:hypothetical protein